jgi:hypothetical protein
VFLNHPHALDLSRLGLPDSVRAPAHSHIITDRQAGWHNTVNIRVTSLAVWNEIAAAKSLTKVRELQAARSRVAEGAAIRRAARALLPVMSMFRLDPPPLSVRRHGHTRGSP